MAVSSCHFLPTLLSKQGPCLSWAWNLFPKEWHCVPESQGREARAGLASLAPEIEASSPQPCPPPHADVGMGPGVPISKIEIFPRALAGGSYQLAQRLRPERKHKQRGDDLTFNGTSLGPCRAAKQTVSYAKLLGGAVTQTTPGHGPCSLPSPKLMTRLHAQELWATSALIMHRGAWAKPCFQSW